MPLLRRQRPSRKCFVSAGIRWVLSVGLACTSASSVALAPQTGIYWNPAKPGTAIYVESQNGTIFAVLYGYSNADGEPEFYVSSGPTIPSVPADFIPSEGLYPIDGFGSPLYRVPSGSCLACPYAPIAPAERVGTLQMMFPARGGLFATVFFADGRTFPNDRDQFGETMVRFNFALGGVPTSPPPSSTYIDMRGEWVFADMSDPLRVPWRFNFTEREDGADLSDYPLLSSVAFRDPARGAVLYCATPDVARMPPEQRQSVPGVGCELRQGDATLFWSSNEISVDEFVGTLGGRPPRSAGVFRGDRRVIGRRVSD